MADARTFNALETKFHGRYAKSLVDTLFQAYRPMLGRTCLFVLLGFLGRLALLGNANLVGFWVDSFCGAPAICRPQPALLDGFNSSGFLWLLVGATLTGFVLTVIYRVGISRLSVEAVSRVYDETTLRTSRLPMSFFDRNPAGRVMTRFSSDYNNVFRIFGGPLAEFIGLIFEMLAMTVLITIASPWFLPFWLMQAALNFTVYRWHLPRLRLERREVAARRSSGIAHFAETSNGAATIRAFGKQADFERKFSELNDSYLVQRLNSMSAFVRFSLSMSAATAVSFLFTGLASAWLAHTGRISVGAIGVAFAYLGLSSNILQSFFEWLGQFEEAMTGLERMNEYLRAPLEPGAKLPHSAAFETEHPRETALPLSAGKPRWDGAGEGASIEVKELWMRYREDLPPVLQGIDLAIRPGERLAVVGKTGSGKTSFVQALFRLYPIERGRIRIAGREAEVRLDTNRKTPPGAAVIPSAGGSQFVDLREYRSLLSYITQEATLFLGTLRENLTAPESNTGSQSFSEDARLVQALRRVQFLSPGASDEKYRHWLEYPIEERGRNVSAGERQLICMARCLLQDTPVVILDEATSAVDPLSEEILTRATEEFFVGKTQILIAHRLSTVRGCDRVLWLQNGRVHRLGTPAEVLPEFERAELDV